MLGRRGTLSHTLSSTRLLQLLALEAGSVKVAPRQPRAIEHGTFEPRPLESRAYDKSTSLRLHAHLHRPPHVVVTATHNYRCPLTFFQHGYTIVTSPLQHRYISAASPSSRHPVKLTLCSRAFERSAPRKSKPLKSAPCSRVPKRIAPERSFSTVCSCEPRSVTQPPRLMPGREG